MRFAGVAGGAVALSEPTHPNLPCTVVVGESLGLPVLCAHIYETIGA